MTAPACTDEEFIDLFERTGGSLTEVAKILGVGIRGLNGRRRSIEQKLGRPLLSKSPKSPDYNVVSVEFPEWDQLEIKDGYLVAFSDAHLLPGMKSTAHRALLRLIPEIQPLALVDLGDLLDFALIGRHHRIGWDDRLAVKKEIDWGRGCLEEMVSLGPKKMKRKRTRGNHDQRFGGFLANRVPEAEGLSGTKLEDHLPGWPCSWSIMVNDNELCMTHRWKGSVHGPHNNTLWSGVSYATGHQHKQQVYPLTDLRGDRWGVDIGTLACINSPLFRYGEGKPKNWRAGFAVFRFVNYKLRHPELLRVIDEDRGLVEFRGKDIRV